MRKYYFWTVTAIVTLALSSCGQFGGGGGGGNNDPEFQLSDLQGLWLEEIANKPEVEHYVRFTDEQAVDEGYFFGREWNLDEDVKEEDLYKNIRIDTVWTVDPATQDSTYALDTVLIHGNGWFEYQLETKGDLHEIHFMDNGGADIPKEYIVAILTDTRLEYYEKANKNRRTYFNKIVEKKN
jgi:hypothetical protein